MANINVPSEKKCQGACGLVKPFTEFYPVTSYPDHLSRVCKPCNTIDTRLRGYRRLLKRKGTAELEQRIAHYRMLADELQSVLDSAK